MSTRASLTMGWQGAQGNGDLAQAPEAKFHSVCQKARAGASGAQVEDARQARSSAEIAASGSCSHVGG